jgi:hypothetical protein
MIDREFLYTPDPDVQTACWKDAPKHVRKWCLSVWKDEFGLRRSSMGDTDIVAWVPRISILAAKRGRWIGPEKSFNVVAMCFNYVDREHRQKGWSGKLIMTLCHKATEVWGPTPFIFEIQDSVPRGLRDIKPFLRFTYTWIPFLYVQVPPKWKPISLDGFASIPGFHPNETSGYLAFQHEHDGHRVLLDPHNDILFYDDFVSLCTFDAIQTAGAYCRIFSPIGTSQIFLENMYFEDPPQFDHFILP